MVNFQENISLSEYSTFKIGGRAKYFFLVKTKEDLIIALKKAKELRLHVFLIGGGSNILFKDSGFKGLVLKIDIEGFKLNPDNVILSYAGTKLRDLVIFSLKESLTGLEWLAGIPGTLGGAVFGNAGAFWHSMQDIIKEVEVLDKNTFKIKKISLKECRFKNKDSIFKHKQNYIILSCLLRVKKGKQKEIKEKIKEYLNYRKEKHPLAFPSAGCAFKNHVLEVRNKGLLKRFPEISDFNKKGRIPTAYLIEKAGLSGKKVGKAQVSEKHSNFIINLRGAKAKDVIKLINLVKSKVKKKFGIILEDEIQICK